VIVTGTVVGATVGAVVGAIVGAIVGVIVGENVGARVTIALGLSDGFGVNTTGVSVGASVLVSTSAVLGGSVVDGGDVSYKGPPTEEQSKMSSPLTYEQAPQSVPMYDTWLQTQPPVSLSKVAISQV